MELLGKLKPGISPIWFLYERLRFMPSIQKESTEERIKKLKEFDSKYGELI